MCPQNKVKRPSSSFIRAHKKGVDSSALEMSGKNIIPRTCNKWRQAHPNEDNWTLSKNPKGNGHSSVRVSSTI